MKSHNNSSWQQARNLYIFFFVAVVGFLGYWCASNHFLEYHIMGIVIIVTFSLVVVKCIVANIWMFLCVDLLWMYFVHYASREKHKLWVSCPCKIDVSDYCDVHVCVCTVYIYM